MSAEGIRAEELPRWVPGHVVLASDGLDWQGVKLRSYRYTPLDVEVPPLQDFMIVAYRRGPTPMERRFDGRWRQADLEPGDVSLLSRAQQSHWHWTRGIEVVHVYLTRHLMQQVCEEVFEQPLIDVRLADVLKTHDPVLFEGAMAIAREVAEDNIGGALYVDAIARRMCLHALRHYACVTLGEAAPTPGLSAAQARRLRDYIEANLAATLTCDRLAAVAGVSSHYLLRHFKARFGCAPHAYVLARRVERARRLLAQSAHDLREVAMLTGFSDQPHLTRVFRRCLGTTPAAYRRAVRG
jgi:AraC family transcriptional regulator